MTQVAVRAMRPGDDPFVFRSWLKACRKCERHHHLPSAVYYQDVHEQIERLIAARPVQVLMAVDADSDDTLRGFICTERLGGRTQVLHFAYVKKADRRLGVAKRLAAAAGLDLRRPFLYTFHTTMASDLVREFPQAMYRRDVLALPR